MLLRSEIIAGRIFLCLLGVWLWLIVASFVFCWGFGRLDIFRFPWMQWAEAAFSGDQIFWLPPMKGFWSAAPTWFAIGFVAASLPLVIAARALGLRRQRQQLSVRAERPLHGMASTLTPADLPGSGFSLSERIFPSRRTRS